MNGLPCRRVVVPARPLAIWICVALMAPLTVAVSMAAVDLAGVRSATLEWTAASGPVAGYEVHVSRNGEPFRLEQKVSGRRATVGGSFGETIRVRVAAFAVGGELGPFSPASEAITFVETMSSSEKASLDFDGDGFSDAAAYVPANGDWAIETSRNGSMVVPSFGASGDLPEPADYDGDGVTDVAIYRPSEGAWFFHRPGGDVPGAVGSFGGHQFLPVPADYDGDGLDDIAVYDREEGAWFEKRSSAGGAVTIVAGFGGPAFDPVPADYDGDGRVDPAVYRLSDGAWFAKLSGSAGRVEIFGGLGGPSFVPVPADYDGDGIADPGVYETATGGWFWMGSHDGFSSKRAFGGAGYVPVPADYDGDGRVDPAVVRRDEGRWFYAGSRAGFQELLVGFGESGTTLLAAPRSLR